MTREEARETLEFLKIMDAPKLREAVDMAIEALKLTLVKECSTCSDKGCCAIFDNFNIDYCSDYRGGQE